MEQPWFEMSEVRRRKLATAVWIPLRASQKLKAVGDYGYQGYLEEYFGARSVMIPVEQKQLTGKLDWQNIGLSDDQRGWVNDSVYIPARECQHYEDDLGGEHLVLSQHFNSQEPSEWHLSEDLALTLGLKREGDIWVRPAEGYIEIARLTRDDDGSPLSLEIRSSHLRDYLCARNMGLFISTYRSRTEVSVSCDHLSWEGEELTDQTATDRWTGRALAIHEGGMRFGEKVAVFHMSRTDVDPEDDVPSMGLPNDGNVDSKQWTHVYKGNKLFRISGELWTNEWIEPASASPLVREDKVPSTASFIVDAAGTRETEQTLVNGDGRWLWFRPEVVSALLSYRGSSLKWYTADTGEVGCSPDCGVHFGINSIGLLNVYAKDIALLPDWQQRVWAGFNIGPEGKVSGELLASQVDAKPADTQAPEDYLESGLAEVADLSYQLYGEQFIRPHEKTREILRNSHRFRATDLNGLFALAKDLARLTVDSFDVSAMHKVVAPPKGANWGSLKSMENVLAKITGDERAHAMMGPLFKIYDLRKADAHLPSEDVKEACHFLGLDPNLPFVTRGHRLLVACVSSLYAIAEVFQTELRSEGHNS